jgi:quinol monooxygenase YgiN
MNTLIKSMGLTLMVSMTSGCASQHPNLSPNGATAMQKPLVSIAVLKAKPGQQQALKQGLLALVGPTRTEPGNLDYVLFELRDEPGTFYMREAFKNQAALDAHFATPYFKEFAANADSLLKEPLQLIFLEQVSN